METYYAKALEREKRRNQSKADRMRNKREQAKLNASGVLTNEGRADFAEQALKRYVKIVRGETNDSETNIGDLLCDIMHLCDRKGLDFSDRLEHAYGHYGEETDRANFGESSPKAELDKEGEDYAREASQACAHLNGYWINEEQGNFRCLGCGFQQWLKDLPPLSRNIGPWEIDHEHGNNPPMINGHATETTGAP